jgi:hypothetical protein
MFGDGNRVTVPNAASSTPTSLKVAQQPSSVAAAVATQVARETVAATPAASGPLLRSRDNEADMSAAGGDLPMASGGGSDVPDLPSSSSAGSAQNGSTSSVGPAQDSTDTAHDRAWLETHARALYPFIRAEIRGELLRDRERRGRLMREQR